MHGVGLLKRPWGAPKRYPWWRMERSEHYCSIVGCPILMFKSWLTSLRHGIPTFRCWSLAPRPRNAVCSRSFPHKAALPLDFAAAQDSMEWPIGVEDLKDHPAGVAKTAPELKREEPLPGMMGTSGAMQRAFHLARLVIPRSTTVLITGETGTGKELMARAIHNLSPRAQRPFVIVNCAAIPEALLESELFGHTRGAFTGAFQSRLGRIHSAHSGTLFLDEVGELPVSMQGKLLRFLQGGEVQRLGSPDVFQVDVRVIAATNADLARAMSERRFNDALYYRLSVFPIELPPLRERRDDILPLATHFLDSFCREAAVPFKSVSFEAVKALEAYAWPGNVRELEHVMERAFSSVGKRLRNSSRTP